MSYTAVSFSNRMKAERSAVINPELDGLFSAVNFESQNTLPLPCGMLISTLRVEISNKAQGWGCLIAMRFYDCE